MTSLRATARRATAPRSHSLKSRKRIAELFKSATRRSGKFLTVFCDIPDIEDNQEQAKEVANWRYLVAVPKRIGKATLRNRVRRVLREAIRLNAKLRITEPTLAGDLVIRYNGLRRKGKSVACDLTNNHLSELRAEFAELFDDIIRRQISSPKQQSR